MLIILSVLSVAFALSVTLSILLNKRLAEYRSAYVERIEYAASLHKELDATLLQRNELAESLSVVRVNLQQAQRRVQSLESDLRFASTLLALAQTQLRDAQHKARARAAVAIRNARAV